MASIASLGLPENTRGKIYGPGSGRQFVFNDTVETTFISSTIGSHICRF